MVFPLLRRKVVGDNTRNVRVGIRVSLRESASSYPKPGILSADIGPVFGSDQVVKRMIVVFGTPGATPFIVGDKLPHFYRWRHSPRCAENTASPNIKGLLSIVVEERIFP